MEEQRPSGIEQISQADWERTLASVKTVVETLVERMHQWETQVRQLQSQVEQLEAENQLLREQVNRTSANSSQPPSQAPPSGFKPSQKTKSGKKRGAQSGHEGHERRLYSLEQCDRVTDYYLETCWYCEAPLQGEDPVPYRHQVVEIPPVKLQLEEHRFHQLTCACCGAATRALHPDVLAQGGYGERVVAHVGLLSSVYRHSHRTVQRALQDMFGVEISLGSINQLRQEVSAAVAEPVAEVGRYVKQHPVVGADETSFEQRNADGQNPQHRQGWLWVVVTPLVTFFQVLLSRSQAAAQVVLGSSFNGTVISDRHGAYTWLDLTQRQVCWAHLKRDFTQIAERTGVCGELGQALLEQEKQLFELWYQVRDSTLNRAQFRLAVAPIRASVKALLTEATNYPVGTKEKTPWAKTVRTCQNLLNLEPALWLFVTLESVEPTNNAAERAIRPAVLWRRTSFGSQSAGGSIFVARLLTVVTTLQAQKRDVLDYLTQACRAALAGQPAPSLLPLPQSPQAGSSS